MKKIPVYGIKEFSEKDQEAGFYSNDLTSHLKSHQFVNAPHKHNSYITILFTHGTGEHYIDFAQFPVRPGSIFLLNPGQVHSWRLSRQVKGFVFIHTREFYDRIFLDRKLGDFPFFYLEQSYPAIYLSVADHKKIGQLFRTLHEEYRGNSTYKMEKLGSLTDLLYMELAELYSAERQFNDTHSNYVKVRKLQKLIDDHFRNIKSPGAYADQMHMSIRHLNRICQDTIGKTTGTLIIDRIILEAKRMLIQKDVTISQVAGDLGYEDHSYFIRLFKKKTGGSPKEFQKKMII